MAGWLAGWLAGNKNIRLRCLQLVCHVKCARAKHDFPLYDTIGSTASGEWDCRQKGSDWDASDHGVKQIDKPKMA